MNETTVTVVGNIITEPVVRQTSEDKRLVHFRVASTERRYDRATGQWVDGGSLFVNVTCWRRLADEAAECLGKGDPVVVTGRLSTRSYEVDGQRRWSTDLVARALGPDLSRCRATVKRPAKNPAPATDVAGQHAAV